jgi:adenylate cyclase
MHAFAFQIPAPTLSCPPMNELWCRLGLRFREAEEEASFFAEYGTTNLAFVRTMLLVGGALFVLFVVWDRIIDPVGAQATFWVRVLLLAPAVWLAAALLNRRLAARFAEPIMVGAAIISTACISAVCAMLTGGMDFAGGGLILVILFVFALLPMRAGWYLLFCLTTMTSYYIAQSWALPFRPGMPLVNTIMLATALFLGGITVVFRERNARVQYRTMHDLADSRAQIEELLHSMLPSSIVRRMQNGETQIADLHGEVSIVFSDLVGFTELSRRISAAELVKVLNQLFSAFDRAADEHGMHKIKTIGDAYMAVGGLLSENPAGNPAICAAEFAFAMLRAADDLGRRLDIPLNVRVGLHVGPVVAGVIGTSRPAFDCWGEAVNLASRLESSARPGDVLLSERAQELLRDHYLTEPLQDVALKGIGLAKVYRLPPVSVAA